MGWLNQLWRRLVEFGFRLLYYEFAWTYDLVSWSVSLGRWRQWQLASLEFVTGPNVLELAHGPGHMLVELHSRGFQTIGGDLSPFMSRMAAARLKQHRKQQSVGLARFEIPDLPFAAESFNTILSQFPTGYITERATIEACHRLLKPGGRLVILPEGHLTGRGPLRRFIAWLFLITGQSVEGNTEWAEALKLRWALWEAEIRSAGFEVDVYPLSLPGGSQATVIVATKSDPEFDLL